MFFSFFDQSSNVPFKTYGVVKITVGVNLDKGYMASAPVPSGKVPKAPAPLLYDEYAALTQRYKALYGEDTVVLMEVGTFLEFYCCDRDLGADVPRVCGLLNVQMTRKTKAIAQVSRTNPRYGGVPTAAAAKYVQVLVDAGFTVALAMQVTPPPDIRREVTEVVSPSTVAASTFMASFLSDASSCASGGTGYCSSSSSGGSTLMAVRLEEGGRRPNGLPGLPGPAASRGGVWSAAGWATVDLATGRTTAGEVVAPSGTAALDALRRAAVESAPSEVVVSGCLGCLGMPEDSKGSAGNARDEMSAALGVPRRAVHLRPPIGSPSDVNAILSRAFPKTGFLTPAEFVDLERMPYALEALAAAIQFAHEHNDTVVARIQRPDVRGVFASDDVGQGPEDYAEEDAGDSDSSSVATEDTGMDREDREDDGDHEGCRVREVETSPDVLRQLDVVGAGRDGPGGSRAATLLRILGTCRTAGGRRAFRDRLVRPVSSVPLLVARYDAVDDMLILLKKTESPSPMERIQGGLDAVGDVERAFRGVCLRRTTAAELPALVTAFAVARDVLRWAAEACVVGRTAGRRAEARRKAADIAAAIVRHVAASVDVGDAAGDASGDAPDASGEDIEDVRMQSQTHTPGYRPPLGDPPFTKGLRSFFVRGVHRDVDAAQDELDQARSVFFQAARALNAAIGAEHVAVVEDGPIAAGSPMALAVTARRWAVAVASGAAQRARVPPWFVGSDASLCGDVKGTCGPRRLVHPALGPAACERVSRASAELGALLSERLGALLDEVAEAHGDDAWTVARALEDVDVCLACARNAVRLGHVRPVLRDTRRGSSAGRPSRSFFRAKGLRHPIIEALDRGERYVPNDVSLGCDGIGGILLYGVNAVGKSSAMKAVGLATLMAQAGMFVACASLELAPFTGLFTRIGLRDDLARGHSTFVVEMLELRTILARASRRSLVIGDELCAGTESPSALSIVGAGVLRLAARGAPFVFATHLHELVTAVPLLRPVLFIEDAAEEEEGAPGAARGGRKTPSKGLRVRAMHLSVQMDAATGRLVLDRTLRPGSGPPTYGIEVCRSLDMGDVFIRTADRIRRHLLGVPETLLGPGRKPSRYNASVVVDRCGVCGAPAEETHHIVPQAVAAPHEKNRSHNLAPLCAACHAATHGTSQLDIRGYVATSEGLVLATSGSRGRGR